MLMEPAPSGPVSVASSPGSGCTGPGPGSEPLPLAVFRVPPAWHALIEQVNGQASLASIVAHEAERRGIEIDDVRRALYLGLSCELLRAT